MSEGRRTLYIHVGPAKTGTSAIQHYFAGLDLPDLTYPRSGQWPDRSHNMLGFSLGRAKRWGAVEVAPLEELAPKFSAELDNAEQDALISSEGLANPEIYGTLLTTFAPAIARFDRVVPIFVIRHPVEAVASRYNQAVKDSYLGEKTLPDAYLTLRIAQSRLVEQVAFWRAKAPAAKFLLYHPAQTLLARFCQAIDRPDLAPATAEWRNRSLGGVGLALCLLGNRHLESESDRRAYFQSLRETPGLRMWRGASFPFSREATSRALDTVVNPELDRLFDRFGMDARNWTPPDRVQLAADELAQVSEIAQNHLPRSAALTEDIDRVTRAIEGGHADAGRT